MTMNKDNNMGDGCSHYTCDMSYGVSEGKRSAEVVIRQVSAQNKDTIRNGQYKI